MRSPVTGLGRRLEATARNTVRDRDRVSAKQPTADDGQRAQVPAYTVAVIVVLVVVVTALLYAVARRSYIRRRRAADNGDVNLSRRMIVPFDTLAHLEPVAPALGAEEWSSPSSSEPWRGGGAGAPAEAARPACEDKAARSIDPPSSPASTRTSDDDSCAI